MTATILVTVAIIIYSLPSLISLQRNPRDATAIYMTLIFLGWTGIGWVVALIWACTGNVNKKN